MAQYEEFSIDQGTDVTIQLNLTNPDGSTKDLSGYSINAQIRKTVSTSDSDAITFNSTVLIPTTDGKVNLSLTNAQTDAMVAGRYFYDVEISHNDSDGNTIIERILEGKIDLTPSITRIN
jgi:hypothetical protein